MRREGSPFTGLGPVFMKELSDHLSSTRMLVLTLFVIVFGALPADVPALTDYLGDTRFFIDTFAEQSAQGMEILPGEVSYVFRANWKLPEPRYTSGLLAKYARLAQGAETGAITNI